MSCVKCGGFSVATTDGLCVACANQAVPRRNCIPMQPDNQLKDHEPPEWFKQMYHQGYRSVVDEQLKNRQIRVPWDLYFLTICDAVKLRSIDVDTQNGAVIVNAQHRIVSTGYNAFPAGVDDGFWPNARNQQQLVPKVGVARPINTVGCLSKAAQLSTKYVEDEEYYRVDKYMPMTHAEMNAVVSAGQDLHGCCIYTLLFPCHECAKAIITSGIKRVVYSTTREDISWAVAKELFIQADVELVGPEKPEA